MRRSSQPCSAERKRSPRRSPSTHIAASNRRIDPGIRRAVQVLAKHGVETFESCQGGAGHSFPEPTVRFYGSAAEGFRALAVALQHDLKVSELRRFYYLHEGEPHGPYWEMTFVRQRR